MENEILQKKMVFASKLPEKVMLQSSPDGIECDLCGGNGYIITDEDGYEVAVPCKCLEKRQLQSRLRFADLPESLKDVRLNTFSFDVYQSLEARNTIATACIFIKQYLMDFEEERKKGMGLYLYSARKGSGKTRMAASIANELIYNHGIGVKFATSIAILDAIKGSWDSKEYTERELLDSLFMVPVLVIDDFGTERTTDFANDRFYQIINQRYINTKVTIFTSNMSLSSIKYDERITNRIKERTYAIDFPEESVREWIAENNHQEMRRKIFGKNG